jgi:hypothetical protein
VFKQPFCTEVVCKFSVGECCNRSANAKEKGFFAFGDHKEMKQREGFSTWHVGMILATLLCKGKN